MLNSIFELRVLGSVSSCSFSPFFVIIGQLNLALVVNFHNYSFVLKLPLDTMDVDSKKKTVDSGSAMSRAISSQEGHLVDTALDTRRFNIWSAIGVQFAVAAAPIAVTGFASLILGAGGSPFFFWAYVVAIFGQALVALSLAEIAGAIPHASGARRPSGLPLAVSELKR